MEIKDLSTSAISYVEHKACTFSAHFLHNRAYGLKAICNLAECKLWYIQNLLMFAL